MIREMWRQRAIWSTAEVLLTRSCKNYQCLLTPRIFYSTSDNKKRKLAPLQERKMRDKIRVWGKGGEGGNGCWSYRRSRMDRHGKPDGGNGGRGGDVILECSSRVWDFSSLQHHLNGKRGGPGASKNMIGTRGSDKVIQVPVGTVIHLVSGEAPSIMENTASKPLDPWEIPEVADSDLSEAVHSTNNESVSGKTSLEDSSKDVAMIDRGQVKITSHKEIEYNNTVEEGNEMESEGTEDEENEEDDILQYSVVELTKPGQRMLVARGGEGGLGNTYLKKENRSHKKNNYNYAIISSPEPPLDTETQSSFTKGMPGTESVLILELKSIADVGLVGMPNAGKSTLLGAISRAKPAVGHYAFTTLRPNIGNLNYEDFSMTIADIPGLIKGAHENRGLGHAFLRHIERTKVLVYVVDLAAALEGRKGIPPWEQLRDLVMELEYHQEGMSKRPSTIVANKIDEEGAENVLEEFKRRVQGVRIYPVCAVLGEGISELKAGLRRLVDGSESQEVKAERIIVD